MSSKPGDETTLTLRSLLLLLARNGLLLVALSATLVASAVLTMRIVLSSRNVAVPPLVGRRLPDAGALAAGRGLSLRVEGRRHDATVPPEHVLSQEPPPGGSLKAHRSVRVWVSLGPHRVVVPSVEGDSARAARVALEQAGVSVARIVEVDDLAPEGTVLVQHPPAGDTEADAVGASLLVSRGAGGRDLVMPDLIGRDAMAVLYGLRVAGLKVADIRYRLYPGVAPGIVIRQTPPAGHRMSSRTPVILDVSKAES